MPELTIENFPTKHHIIRTLNSYTSNYVYLWSSYDQGDNYFVTKDDLSYYISSEKLSIRSSELLGEYIIYRDKCPEEFDVLMKNIKKQINDILNCDKWIDVFERHILGNLCTKGF